jgi:hypothetical protein
MLCGAAVGTVAVALTILAFFAIVVLNVQKLTRHWSEDVQVVAFIDTVPEERVLRQWIADIRGLPEVEKVEFVSRAEALKRFKKRLADDADLLEGVDPDILPASLEITLKEGSRNRVGVSALVTRLRHNTGFSDLRYGQEWLERFESFVSLLRLAGAILGGFLLFAALFIVANTIKLTPVAATTGDHGPGRRHADLHQVPVSSRRCAAGSVGGRTRRGRRLRSLPTFPATGVELAAPRVGRGAGHLPSLVLAASADCRRHPARSYRQSVVVAEARADMIP